MTAVKFIYLRAAIAILISIWTLGFLYPLIGGGMFLELFIPLKKMYSMVCHQNAGKTISCAGNAALVCTRCAGIYAGALIGSIYLLITYNKKLSLPRMPLLLAAVPVIIDSASVTLGIYSYSFAAAFFSGMLFGSTVIIYILAAIENSLLNRYK